MALHGFWRSRLAVTSRRRWSGPDVRGRSRSQPDHMQHAWTSFDANMEPTCTIRSSPSSLHLERRLLPKPTPCFERYFKKARLAEGTPTTKDTTQIALEMHSRHGAYMEARWGDLERAWNEDGASMGLGC